MKPDLVSEILENIILELYYLLDFLENGRIVNFLSSIVAIYL